MSSYGLGGFGKPLPPLGQGYAGGGQGLIGSPIGGPILPPRPRQPIPSRRGRQVDTEALLTSVFGDKISRNEYDDLVQKYEAMNIPEPVLSQLRTILKARTAFGIHPHKSALQEVAGGLRKIENVGAGFAHGFQASKDNPLKGEGSFSNILKRELNPVNWYHAIGAGFSDVPQSIHQDYTFDQYLREAKDPNSIMYKHNKLFGLGFAMVFDPTTYLTFGASTPSKVAAYRILADTQRDAFRAADKMITKTPGKVVDTHFGPLELNHNNRDLIAEHIAIQEGLPMSAGDALTVLRNQGGRLGGRGIRFMGKEIPGTPGLGTKMGQTLRRERARSGAAHMVGSALIPDWAARAVVEDKIRASALVEMARYRTSVQATQMGMGRAVRQLQRPTLTAAEDLTHYGLSEPVQVLIKPTERADLYDINPAKLNPVQRQLKNNIDVEVKAQIEESSKAGLNRKSLEQLWQAHKDFHGDPLMALAEFKFKATARAMGHTFVGNILKDLRFALPLAREGEAAGVMVSKIPQDYSKFTFGGRSYAVRDALMPALREITDPTLLDNSIHQGMRMLNIPQNWWKIYATSPNPAFHVMNFLGATWNNMLAGVYNPMNYFDAMRTIYGSLKEEAAQTGRPFGITRGVPESTTFSRERHALAGELEARAGGGRGSFLFADASRGLMSATSAAKSDVPLAKLDPTFSHWAGEAFQSGQRILGRRTVQKTSGAFEKESLTRYGARLARRGTGLAAAVTLNPFTPLFFMPELAKAGRRFGGTIEDVVRLAPFTKYANDPQIKRALAEFGPIASTVQFDLTQAGAKSYKIPEATTKQMSARFTKADQQTMYDIGAAISQHFQFDYTNLTGFERYVAKTIFPFWVYYKKNLALQVSQLGKRPLPFAAALRTMNFIDENGMNYKQGPWKEILPTYFNTLNAFQIPVPSSVRTKLGLPQGAPLYLNPKLPFLSINLIPNLWEVLRDPTETTNQKFLETISPIAGQVGPFSASPLPGAKILLEAGVGWNFGLNRPIDFMREQSSDLRQSHVEAPAWFQYLPKGIQHQFGAFTNPKTGKTEITPTVNYVIQQFSNPFVNNLAQSVPTAGATGTDKAKATANLVSWLTGIRLLPVDTLKLARNETYNFRNHLQAKQTELRHRGKELNDSDAEALWLINHMLDDLNYYYNQREGYDTSR